MRRIILAVAGVSLVPALAAAHDTWVLPAKPRVRPGETVRLEATSGMEFPKLESPIAADRIARAELRIGRSHETISNRRAGKSALTLTVRPRSSGTAVVFLETRPRSIDLTPAQVKEYLAEIGATDAHRQWKAAGSGRWHETYAKHCKTFLAVEGGEGESTGHGSWDEAGGMALEIVPESNPTRIAVGDELSLRVLRARKAEVGLPVKAQSEERGEAAVATTDRDGRARVRFDRAGWWLIKATRLEREGSRGDWTSHFTTLTLHVSAR